LRRQHLCIFWKRYKKPVIANKTLTRGRKQLLVPLLVLQAVSNRAKPPMGSNVMSLVCIP
jgi:hypothetical protein